jgi:hypothetical protein
MDSLPCHADGSAAFQGETDLIQSSNAVEEISPTRRAVLATLAAIGDFALFLLTALSSFPDRSSR